MNFELAESVVGVLRSGSDARIACLRLERFREADWQRAGFWLDASGLALHLWDTLSHHRLTEILPPSVQARLRQNCYDNRRRTEAMFAQFASINAALDTAGIEYAKHGFMFVRRSTSVAKFPVGLGRCVFTHPADAHPAQLAAFPIQWLNVSLKPR